jgi:cysteine desulfurase
MRSQGIINKLQDRGVYVSAGSACSRGHRSHVLEAMGVDPLYIDGAVRISLSRETTRDDVALLIKSLRQIL